MKAVYLFKKKGYKKRCESKNSVIYDLVQKENNKILPDTILFSKGLDSVSRIEFLTDNPDKYILIGTFSFEFDSDMLIAINTQIKEIEEKLKNKF